MTKVLDIRKLAKVFRLDKKAATTLRESVMNRFFSKSIKTEILQALNDISFSVHRGEVVGITGHNGAGKSTLLRILAGITHPSSGEAEIYGRCASLLEIGTGFHPELTGRENVYFNASLLGFKRAEVDEYFHDILEFSEIQEFIDVPVKRYSSGMYVRLAFAIAAHLHVALLVIDEVLAVGDERFQEKCRSKIRQLADEGTAIVIVSHNSNVLESFVSRLILLEKGQLIFDGNPHKGIELYRKLNQ